MMLFSEKEFEKLREKEDFEPRCIAVNSLYEVYLSPGVGEVFLTVFQDGEAIDEVPVYDWGDVEEVLCAYLIGEGDYTEEDEEDDDHEYEIAVRESELDDIIRYFITDVTGEHNIEEDMIEDCKEHFLRYLYQWGFEIYRPMILEDENGEFFEEYPYDCLVFEDEEA